MSDRKDVGAGRRGLGVAGRAKTGPPRRSYRPSVEGVESRQLLAAALAPIGPVSSPEFLGLQVPLDGVGAGNQTFRVTSSNPDVVATVADGPFLRMTVSHASSGPNDPAFTGTIVFQLFEDLTPVTVDRITTLVEQGFYTGRNFHRIAPNFPGPNDFIVQGGSVNGSGSGEVNQPGFPFPDEFVQQLAFTGEYQLAMANAGDDTNSSQFFITTGSPRFLDFQHTIFGQLVSGQETVEQMTRVARGGSDLTTPITPVLIDSASVFELSQDGVIHIDTTGASAGETSTITVTATETSSGTQATQTFTVNVTENTDNARPYLLPVPDQTVATNQPAIFQLRGVSSDPRDTLIYTVQGGISGSTFTPVQNATATVDSSGVVTVTPNAGFTGTIPLVVGVRDQVNRGGSTLDSPVNYDTQRITLTVRNGQPVNLTPIALPVQQGVVAGQPNRVQLVGSSANPQSNQGVTYSIVNQPTGGTITSFDPRTGSLVYTPGPNFTGRDTLQYTVTDVGAPTPNLTSPPATVTLVVSGSAVRQIGRVLIVTPPPREDGGTNNIDVTEFNGRVRVEVNGIVDVLQPRLVELDRLIVYGSKANDNITVSDDVDLLATLDGGQGGANRLHAGGAPTRLHGWFGRNILQGGPFNDELIGRRGHAAFRPSGGNDLAFLGVPRASGAAGQDTPPGGTFYRFVRGRLVEIPTPRSRPFFSRGTANTGPVLPPGFQLKLQDDLPG